MTDFPPAFSPPPPHVAIRPVQLLDAEALQRHCWTERTPSSVYQIITRAQQNLRRNRGIGVVILGSVVPILAFGQLTVWPNCTEISDLIVAPDYRNQGYGTALIQFLSRHAATLNASCIEIGAALRNPRAIALYRRMGFVDDRTLRLNLGDGEEDVLFLRLLLTQYQCS